ncbi:MAG: hypothetical protein ACM3QZ_03155 [Solirubrobacterales bacterium]
MGLPLKQYQQKALAPVYSLDEYRQGKETESGFAHAIPSEQSDRFLYLYLGLVSLYMTGQVIFACIHGWGI